MLLVADCRLDLLIDNTDKETLFGLEKSASNYALAFTAILTLIIQPRVQTVHAQTNLEFQCIELCL